jgi:hypothetical protein
MGQIKKVDEKQTAQDPNLGAQFDPNALDEASAD